MRKTEKQKFRLLSPLDATRFRHFAFVRLACDAIQRQPDAQICYSRHNFPSDGARGRVLTRNDTMNQNWARCAAATAAEKYFIESSFDLILFGKKFGKKYKSSRRDRANGIRAIGIVSASLTIHSQQLTFSTRASHVILLISVAPTPTPAPLPPSAALQIPNQNSF